MIKGGSVVKSECCSQFDLVSKASAANRYVLSESVRGPIPMYELHRL